MLSFFSGCISVIGSQTVLLPQVISFYPEHCSLLTERLNLHYMLVATTFYRFVFCFYVAQWDLPQGTVRRGRRGGGGGSVLNQALIAWLEVCKCDCTVSGPIRCNLQSVPHTYTRQSNDTIQFNTS